MTSTLWPLGTIDLAGLVQRRKVSAREATQIVLARIADINLRIKAPAFVVAELALAAAGAAGAALARGNALGPLHGFPVTVKINIDVAGMATTDGAQALKDNIASTDSPLVAALCDAGAVLVGRSTASAFSLRWCADNDLHGRTLNPFAAGVTPGGPAAAPQRRWPPAGSPARTATAAAARCATRPGPAVWWGCAAPWAASRRTRPARPSASSATSRCRCKAR